MRCRQAGQARTSSSQAQSAFHLLAASGTVNGGGLEYRDYAGFERALLQFAQNPFSGRELGERGRQFVQTNYAWPVVERKYLEMVEWIGRKAA